MARRAVAGGRSRGLEVRRARRLWTPAALGGRLAMRRRCSRPGRVLVTSESVTEGHPDKVCDQIADAVLALVLDQCLQRDRAARVACEVAIKSDGQRHLVGVFGEITPLPDAEAIRAVVRRTLREIGYTDGASGFDVEHAEILVLLSEQSADIKRGVDQPDMGAGDQGMMVGYACDETPELMSLPIVLAHLLTRRLAAVRKERIRPWLRPDGKIQVTLEYRRGRPVRVDTILVSAQHAPDVGQPEIKASIRALVIDPVLDEMERVIGRPLRDAGTRHLVNRTGRFELDGPRADAGLTGR